MLRLAMTIVRLLLAAWVGGAALFVMTSVAEQRFTGFSSMIRDQLATIRFPLYYLFAALTLLPATGLLLLMFGDRRIRRSRVLLLASLLATASCLLAAWDYLAVYGPLQDLIVPPGQARTMEFVDLHVRSRRINELHVSLALAAAVLACWTGLPAGQRATEGATSRAEE